MSSRIKKAAPADKYMESLMAQFCGVTGASVKDAKKFLETYHKRLDIAMDAYYNDPNALSGSGPATPNQRGPSITKINAMFDQYKDAVEGDSILIDGTIKLCGDLGVDPEDAILLAIATDLDSKRVADWNRKGWVDGMKAAGCDTIQAYKSTLPALRAKLSSDPRYFQKVYNHTFDFGRAEGQRSMATDSAQAFWSLLLPVGLSGGALQHMKPARNNDDDGEDEDEDIDMNNGTDNTQAEMGWQSIHTDWWFQFLTEKGGKGISKDTWVMLLEFIRTIDSKLKVYDPEAAWPSAIDDFVEYAREKIARGEYVD